MKLKELDRMEKKVLNNSKNINTLFNEIMELIRANRKLQDAFIDLVHRVENKKK